MSISEEVRKSLLIYQRNEITEYYIYRKLAGRMDKHPENKRVLEEIADHEMKHYKIWRDYSKEDVSPSMFKVWRYYLISVIFGFTFAVKLMEGGEKNAQVTYEQVRAVIPEAESIIQEEDEHENSLLNMLDEEKLRYTGSIVLGLNDALVELTGVLAGLTLALQNTKLIVLTGSITGIAAALSMGVSEYLSTKAEDNGKCPVRASIYTGVTYMFTVLFLIFPYLVFSNYYICLAVTLAEAILIIAFFNYYISVAKDEPFLGRFIEMTLLSLSVAGISFLIGYLIRTFLGVEI